MFYLFDPINGVKTKTTYKKLIGITGRGQDTLASLKSKRNKISCINSYLIDDSFSVKELQEIREKEVIKDEIWKVIEGSENYFVSNYGRIKKNYKKSSKLLMPYKKRNHKWLFVKINLGGKIKELQIHKLVADHFVINEQNLKVVWHKNGDLYDNHADNLEWISRSKLGRKTGGLSKGIPVIKIDPVTNEILDEYENMAVAGKENYLHRETIRQCVRGLSKTAGGFKWAIDNLEF